jgi:hypothetical protein
MRRHVSSSPIEALRPLIVDLKQQAPICELRGQRRSSFSVGVARQISSASRSN